MFPKLLPEITKVVGLSTKLYRHEMDQKFEFFKKYKITRNENYRFEKILIDISTLLFDQSNPHYQLELSFQNINRVQIKFDSSESSGVIFFEMCTPVKVLKNIGGG